jgi:hypothetical protein
MSTLTPPKANIPIGWVTINGQRMPAVMDPEWLRYLAASLFDRGGGTNGASTSELEAAAFEDAGIEDLKIRTAQLADEMPVFHVAGDIDVLRAKVDALEQLPAADLTIQNITNVAGSTDVFAATFFGAL